MTLPILDAPGGERFWSAIRFAQVSSAKRERARRAKHLPSELFAEPAWDILLELYAFELVGRRVSEAELAGRLPVPATVSTRWMKMLEVQGLLLRTPAAEGNDQIELELTQRGIAAMDGYFSDQE